MKSTACACACAVLILVLLVAGCIVSDQLTTLTVQPDGSADLVVFRSNLRSTEKRDKAEQELADYSAKFEAQTEDEFARIRDAGGKVVEAGWVRQQAPLSNFVHAHFPSASAVEKFATVKNEDESPLLTTQFHSDGSHRRLTFRITAPPDKNSPFQPSPTDAKQLRQMLADGISETRIAVMNGSITAERGFTVASDRQSVLLEVSEIAELIGTGQGKAELYLEWEVAE